MFSEPGQDFVPTATTGEPARKRKKKGNKKPKAPSLRQGLQTLVFSATLTFTFTPTDAPREEDGDAAKAAKKLLESKLKKMVSAMHVRPNRAVVDLTEAERTPHTLREYRMHCTNLLQKVGDC